MITGLLVSTLAVIWAWEALRTVCPWSLPALVQPFLVFGIAMAISWPDWKVAMAAAGAAGVINALVRDREPVAPSAVRLRAGVGSRIPSLP